MAKRLDFETLIERKHEARMRREEKAVAAIEKREQAAERMVGELNSGKCYVWPVGGKYREGGRAELIAFLIRNKYA